MPLRYLPRRFFSFSLAILFLSEAPFRPFVGFSAILPIGPCAIFQWTCFKGLRWTVLIRRTAAVSSALSLTTALQNCSFLLYRGLMSGPLTAFLLAGDRKTSFIHR